MNPGNLYWTLPLISGLVSLAFALYLLPHRNVSGAKTLTGLMLAVTVWSLGYTLELLSIDLTTKIFWARFNYIGIVFVPPLWLLFSIHYCGKSIWMNRRNRIFLFSIPVITLLLVWTNSHHALIWEQIKLDTSGAIPLLAFRHAIWYWVHTVYAYFLILNGFFLLLQVFVQSPPFYRKQVLILLIGAAAPMAGNFLFNLGLSPVRHLDLTPIAFLVTGMTWTWGILSVDLTRIMPVARETVFESISDGVIIIDPMDHIVDLNPVAEKIIDKPAKKVMGKNIGQILSGISIVLPLNRIKTMVPETWTITGDKGNRHNLEISVSPITDQRNNYIGGLLVFRDISERLRADKERRHHLHFLQNLELIELATRMETEVEVMLDRVIDTVLSIFKCDRAWLLFPCDPEAPFIKIPALKTHPSYPSTLAVNEDIPMVPDTARECRQSLASDKTVTYGPGNDHAMPQKPAARFPVQSQMLMAIHPKIGHPWLFGMHQCSRPRVWEDEERRLFQEIGRRLTDSLSSLLFLKDLKEREAQYRHLVENINEVIFTTDNEGVITYLSPTVELLLGYRPEEVIGHNFLDFIIEKDHTLVLNRFKDVLAGNLQGSEYRVYTKSGKIRWVYSSSTTIVENGRVCGLRGLLTDISERKEVEAERKALEEKLNRSRKMEALGLLAGGVAHDLNNVLSGIVSYPELLLMELPADSPMRSAIMTIKASGQKAAAIVKDLLTLARRGVIISKIVNLNNIVREYLESPEHQKMISYHKNITVETHLPADLMNIKGSPLHLRKALMNLVSNAAEAQTDGGRILIATENRYIDTTMKGYDNIDEGDFVILRVKDEGTGLTPEEQERIFEPFYTKKVMDRSGTGLGMAVVWGTVQDHNGRINLESTEGKGTTFEIFFPVTREPEEKEKVPQPVEAYAGKGEKILVIDDIQEQRQIASQMLTKIGYQVNTVESGEAAVDYLKKESVDLLVLDMIMDPGMDGLDTYREIIKIHPGQKAVIASGYSETDRVKRAQKLGAGKYVRKPYSLEKIGIAVRNELDR
jgi:PAS domain S-box-containing protein